jgi:hypothetical protein
MHKRHVRVGSQPIFKAQPHGDTYSGIHLMEGVCRPFDARGCLNMYHIPVEGIPGPVKGSQAAEPRFVALQPMIQGDLAIRVIIISDQKQNEGLRVYNC